MISMVTDQLVGKKIVFLGGKTHDLHRPIKLTLESYGSTVIFFSERYVPTNIFEKALSRLKKDFYKERTVAYYLGILEETRSVAVDFLFVIRGQFVPEFFLVAFRKQHPDCIFIYYNWDSFKNAPNTRNMLHLYDRKFTFDPQDARKYGMHFRPLYYPEDYVRIGPKGEVRYDLLFIGAAHSDRYLVGFGLEKTLESNGRTAYCHYLVGRRDKWLYYFKKLFDKNFEHVDLSKLRLKSLSLNDILTLYEESNVVLDIHHPDQKGLTMRTFEAVGAKRKLITTNEEIRKFPFCTPNNVYILDRNNPRLDMSFFDSPYQEIAEDLYRRLSISGWLYNLFVDDEADYWNQFM